MSVVINTNFAATVAANNLARSNDSLQKSLNRLSSGSKIVNPSDDAGGLAVAMKLSAAARRSGAAANNIGNAISMLQTQDGVLKVTAKVLDRMSELFTLAQDPTKNTDDISNYSAEFSQLQTELGSLTEEKFNGTALFGTTDCSVLASESGDADSAIEISALNLEGAAGVGGVVSNGIPSPAEVRKTLTEAFNTYLYGDHDAGGAATHTAFDNVVSATVQNTDFGGLVGTQVTDLTDAFHALDVKMQDGATTADEISVDINNVLDAIEDAVNCGKAAAGSVTLNSLTISGSGMDTINLAIQNVATMRATNGAEQSRLGFASEVLSVNKTNIEAATSRIMDVDVAEESTQLARWNILVQAGTAMLSQANQSAQSALKLLQ
jgi:flagellin